MLGIRESGILHFLLFFLVKWHFFLAESLEYNRRFYTVSFKENYQNRLIKILWRPFLEYDWKRSWCLVESGYWSKVGSEAQGFCPEAVSVASREKRRLKVGPWADMLWSSHHLVSVSVWLVAESTRPQVSRAPGRHLVLWSADWGRPAGKCGHWCSELDLLWRARCECLRTRWGTSSPMATSEMKTLTGETRLLSGSPSEWEPAWFMIRLTFGLEDCVPAKNQPVSPSLCAWEVCFLASWYH